MLMRLLASLLSTIFLALGSQASAQSTATVTATTIKDVNGSPLAAGQLCFFSICVPVTNGAVDSTGVIAQGTSNISITDGTSALYTISNVVIGGTFSWDTFSLQPGQAATGPIPPVSASGRTIIPCTTGAVYAQSYPNIQWSCTGTNVWLITANLNARTAGTYTGIGLPTFYCTAPCSFIRTDTQTTYTTSAVAGAITNVWNLVFTTNGGNFPATQGILYNTGPTTARNATVSDVLGLFTPCTSNQVLLANGGCQTLPPFDSGCSSSKSICDAAIDFRGSVPILGESRKHPGVNLIDARRRSGDGRVHRPLHLWRFLLI